MPKTTERGVKYSVELPEDLWERAKMLALRERTDLRRLVIEGLELRLAKAAKKKGV
ncbi:MAG TPA: hypothetical protein VMR54_09705 [Thermoanaerobaculia bacterium]|nr:hypothetical protein [Thermoanaerobaculia bacterium]